MLPTEGITIQGELAIALGLTAALVFAGGVAWKADATTLSSTSVTLPHAAKDYSGLLWMGQTLPAGIPLVVRPPPLFGARAARVMNGADKRRFTKFIEAAELGGLELLRSRDPVFTLVSAGNFNTLHVVIRSSWRSDMMARARGCP